MVSSEREAFETSSVTVICFEKDISNFLICTHTHTHACGQTHTHARTHIRTHKSFACPYVCAPHAFSPHKGYKGALDPLVLELQMIGGIPLGLFWPTNQLDVIHFDPSHYWMISLRLHSCTYFNKLILY